MTVPTIFETCRPRADVLTDGEEEGTATLSRLVMVREGRSERLTDEFPARVVKEILE